MQLSVFFTNNLVYILWRLVADYITIVVTIAWRIHLFSFRTQKLSFSAPKVLAGWPAGRIGRCHIIFLDSSAAEHPAVNRRVVGSNPTRGAIFVVRKSYKTKSTRFSRSCAFLLPYLVVRALRGIFEFRSCILTYFSKNRTWTDDFVLIPA